MSEKITQLSPSPTPTPLMMSLLKKVIPTISKNNSYFLPSNPNRKVLSSLEQRKVQSWNTDLTGQTGYKWDIPGMKASNLQSENPYLNEFYRGVNNTAGVAAGTVNYVNNVAGTVIFDLPTKAEELIVSNGGPSFQELFITSQMATPGMPLDDLLTYTLKKSSSFSKNIEIANQNLTPYKPIHFRPGELEKHISKHLQEWVPNNLTKEVYLEKAKYLLSQKPSKKILEHIRKNGDFLRYNVDTNELAIGAPDGTIRTFFRPQMVLSTGWR